MLLRGLLFGPRVSGQDSCAECGTVLDVSFDLGALVAGHAPATTPVTVRVGKRVLRCRPLTTADLIAAAEADGPDFRGGLLARCVTGTDGTARHRPARPGHRQGHVGVVRGRPAGRRTAGRDLR